MPFWLWSYLLTAVGVVGFMLARKKVWWCWYVNLACQGLWLAYALVSGQPGFIAGAIIYSAVFSSNAITWTRERRLDIPVMEWCTECMDFHVPVPGGCTTFDTPTEDVAKNL